MRVMRRRKLRLFMTADAVGGVWQYALDLAGGLAARGVETTLAVLGPRPRADQRADAQAIPGLTLVPTGLPLDWTADTPDGIGSAAVAIADLAREAGADIVHLNSPALAGAASFPAPVLAACHSCVATWWAAVKDGPLPADFQWRTALVGRGYEAADALVAPTKAFAAATAEAYSLTRRPRVVHNGRLLLAAPTAAVVLDPNYVFTAGRLWDDGKNLGVLDRAAARLAVRVVAAGPLEGPNGACIRLDHVLTLGRVGDQAIAHHLSAAPVFVSVARYEPFGLAVLEAAQTGCALVLSDIATFRELWNGAAIFVPPDDEGAIAAALDRVVRDRAERARLGAAARRRARRYTAEAMVAGITGIYRALRPDLFEAVGQPEVAA